MSWTSLRSSWNTLSSKILVFKVRFNVSMAASSWPGSLIMDITFGVEPKAKHDPYIDAAEAGIDTINIAANPGNFMGTCLKSFQ